MAAAIITFGISGKAMSTIQGSEIYQNAANYSDEPATPRATEALRNAKRRRSGKGYTYTVTCDVEAADLIRDYCETVGQTFSMESEPDTRADGRALLAAEQRIAKAMAAAR